MSGEGSGVVDISGGCWRGVVGIEKVMGAVVGRAREMYRICRGAVPGWWWWGFCFFGITDVRTRCWIFVSCKIL